MKFRSRLMLCSVLSAAAVASAVGVVVNSQTQSIAGETLFAENSSLASTTAPYSLDIATQCDPTQQNGTVNYALSGDASGPYGGTYTEQGYFVLQAAKVVEYQANFTITPAGGGAAITGTKTLGGPAGSTSGRCSSPDAAGESTAEMAGLFNYTANVNGTTNSGLGGMSLDVHENSFEPAAAGHAHTDFYGDGKATGGGHILKSPGNPGVHFGFNAQLQNDGTLQGRGVVQDHDADVRIKILTVVSFISTGIHATFTGQAEVNGVVQNYQIDVDDINEPGTGFDMFKITTGTYTREGILTGGNIQAQGVVAVNPSPTPTPTPTPTPIPD